MSFSKICALQNKTSYIRNTHYVQNENITKLRVNKAYNINKYHLTSGTLAKVHPDNTWFTCK